MKDRKHRGFTLIELLIVIVIIAILIAVAIPVFAGILRNAIDKTQRASIDNLNRYLIVEMQFGDFDADHIFTYVKSGEGTKGDFSRYIELNWEVLNDIGDGDNSNTLGLKNLKSGKIGVVNWPSRAANLYSQQALYITTDNEAEYTPDAAKKINEYYYGGVVLWYNAPNASEIYLYYVSPDGMQSDTYYVYKKSDF